MYGIAVENRLVWAFGRNGEVDGYMRSCTSGAVCAPACRTPVFAASMFTNLTAPPTVANRVLYISREADQVNGVVEAFDTRGCAGGATVPPPLWSVTVPGHLPSAPSVVNGSVYVPFTDSVNSDSPGPGVVIYTLP